MNEYIKPIPEKEGISKHINAEFLVLNRDYIEEAIIEKLALDGYHVEKDDLAFGIEIESKYDTLSICPPKTYHTLSYVKVDLFED